MNDLFDMQPQHDEDHRLSRMDRRELVARKKRAAKRRRASMIATLVAVLILGAGVVFAWNVGSKFFADKKVDLSTQQADGGDFTGTGTEPVEVTVKDGDGGGAIAATLLENGVIKSKSAFNAAALANPNSNKIQPGTYLLYKELPAADAINMLLDLKNLAGNRIQVIPGTRESDILQTIKKVTGFTDEQLEAAMKDTEARGLPKVANGNYEGWLADGDYRFSKSETPEEIIEEMVARTVKRLEKLEVPEKKWEETLNVASIVEREGFSKDDFANVASVIYNRLDDGMPLQMDSTVHYFFGGSADASTTKDQRNDRNEWNTYVHRGLPKTPIASPSEAAISAAVNPPKTNYFYFVAVDPVKKITKFSETYKQHQVYVEEYRQWLKENKDVYDGPTQNTDKSDVND